MRSLALVLLIGISLSAFARDASLPIGSVDLTLGAEQSSVMNELKARHFIITVSGQPDTFFISDRKPPDGRILGGVAFNGGRLVWIQRSWGQYSGDVAATDISKALFSALESAARASSSTATVRTHTQRVPTAEFKTVEFQFQNRKVSLLTTDGDSSVGQQVNVDESVGSTNP
jgi:hypothetical protein